MRSDRPTTTELLEIIAETLSDSVVPATAPHAQHQARVAANLCRILCRQLAEDTPETLWPALDSAMADPDGSLVTMNDDEARLAYGEILELVRSKLNVVKPGYDAHDAQAEANVIA